MHKAIIIPNNNEIRQPPCIGFELEISRFSIFKCQKAGNPNIHIFVKIKTKIAMIPTWKTKPVTTDIVGAIEASIRPVKAIFCDISADEFSSLTIYLSPHPSAPLRPPMRHLHLEQGVAVTGIRHQEEGVVAFHLALVIPEVLVSFLPLQNQNQVEYEV